MVGLDFHAGAWGGITSLPQIPVCLTSTITSFGSSISGIGRSSNVVLYGSFNMNDMFWA
jgi:hypothetical protein